MSKCAQATPLVAAAAAVPSSGCASALPARGDSWAALVDAWDLLGEGRDRMASPV